MLERCGRGSKCESVDLSNKVVALLIERGLLAVRRSGLVALTEKGREAVKQRRQQGKRKTAPTRKDKPNHETVDRLHRETGGAVILPFHRRQRI
jgi:hypothetical protein